MNVVLSNLTKKLLAFFMAVIVAIPVVFVPVTAYGASFWDIRDHWAEDYITKAVSSGFVKGYPDGSFKPDNAVSRAEFASMINKALGITGSSSASFKDVPYNEWYYSDVAKGVSAAYAGGYDDNTFRPNNAVTREEAAVMISRFVPTYGVTGNTSTFKDKFSISTWASDAVAKIYGKGYMGAYDDGKYHPQDSLTRAQTAKILCNVLDKETIVSASSTITSKGSSLSGRIYANNVTIDAKVGDGDVDISNCVILGNLYVYGGGEDSVTASNSRIANAYVERTADTVRLLAKGQTTINKTTVGKDAILETSGLSGGLYGTGFNNVDIKSSTDATLKGTFIKVNISGSSANVSLESGSITTLNVTSSGRNSTITVDRNANIGTADVNAAAAFKGSGSINTMNVNSSGVTYETKPRYVKLGSGVSSPDYEDDYDYDIEVDPRHKATKVKVSTDITLTFDTAVTQYDGSTIRSSDISDMVYLREGSSSGKKISFSGTISSNKKEITLDPDSNLDEDEKYYVVIGKNEFLDTKDNGNSAQTTYFSTGDDSDENVTFYPRSGSTDVSRNINPTITFDEAVETYGGRTITDSYLTDSVIIFREGSRSGSKVTFDAEMTSSRKITIEPRSTLKEGQKYYIELVGKKFRTTSDEKNIDTSTATFTVTGANAPTVSFSPGNGATNVALTSTITLNFSSTLYNTNSGTLTDEYLKNSITFRNNTTGQAVPYVLRYSSNTVTLTPNAALVSGNNYTVTVLSSTLKNGVGTYLNSASSTFTATINVNFAILDGSINQANIAKTGVKTSSDGRDVLKTADWVTQPQWDALASAISTATSVRTTATTTVQADAAGKTLDAAVAMFNSAKKKGSKETPNTASLEASIRTAESELIGITVSSNGSDIKKDVKWVTQQVMDTFTNAIGVAKTALTTVQTTADALAASTTLNTAIKSFKLAQSNGTLPDKALLKKTVNEAVNNLASVVSSSDGSDVDPSKQWVSYEVSATYSRAISTASGIADDSNSAQPTVDAALANLNSATDTFDSEKKPGTKADTPPVTPSTP